MTIDVKQLGLVPYPEAYAAMCDFNAGRTPATRDELWLLQHPPVYTLGLSGKREHLLNTGIIPVVETDRGGQVTYHGPGQLIAYLLIDLGRRPYAIKRFVRLVEQALIDYLHTLQLEAERKPGAPGVYLDGKKIAALGVRVKRGATYHGLALNVDMDLAPFKGINPCGYADLECTRLIDYRPGLAVADVVRDLPAHLLKHLDQLSTHISDVA